MFRQLVGLVLLALVAFGMSPAQANIDQNNENNDAYLFESPPIIEFGAITASDTGTRANALQPTFAVGDQSSRSFYNLEIDVMTSGELDNFDVISACFFTSSAASRASERDTLCGYGVASPTSPIANPGPNPSKALSMAWTTDGTFRIDGTNSHYLDTGASTHETLSIVRTVNGTTRTFDAHRLNFRFAISHAAINTSDWTVRVVAVSTPTPKPGDSTPAKQRTELLLDTERCSESYVSQVAFRADPPTANCGTPDLFGVNFFGGFSSSTNRSVDYGSINENSSSEPQADLSTGKYYANDTATLTIKANNFTAGSGGELDTIPLESDFVTGVTDRKRLALECEGDNTLLLSGTVQDFFANRPLSSQGDTAADAEEPEDAPLHSCTLHYGFGAVYANNTYSNEVQIGIKDANLDNGPSNEKIEVIPFG